MAHGFEKFCEDCHKAMAEDPGPGGREKVRLLLEKQLRNEDFVKQYCDAMPFGIHELYHDKDLDFVVLSHVYEKGRESPPHDHGKSWAIYGQARLHTDMTVWDRNDDGSKEGYADIHVSKRFRLDPGMAGTFEPTVIHQIRFPEGARFVRITGTDLNTIATHRFVPEEKKIVVNKGIAAGSSDVSQMRSAT
ncbi:MAG: hypothetical protein AB7F67_05735 [Rhodospirillaceae bacterium]